MHNENICTSLEKQLLILKAFLKEHITSDYAYLDIPGHMNIGDHLIYLGAMALLEHLPYRCYYRSTAVCFDARRVKSNTIILLHGGGNFGDLYPGATNFRNRIVKSFPNNTIIFLPQTVTYIDPELVHRDSDFCSSHKDLHICARDNNSFEFLKKEFPKNNVYLIPDTAIGLYGFLPTKSGSDGESLEIRRKDKEFLEAFDIKADVVKDWDDIIAEIGLTFPLVVQRIIRKFGKLLHSSFFFRIRDVFQFIVTDQLILKRVPRYFLSYRQVYTTRLHGFLLAAMLHIPVEIRDTKYSKISNYINTWF